MVGAVERVGDRSVERRRGRRSRGSSGWPLRGRRRRGRGPASGCRPGSVGPGRRRPRGSRRRSARPGSGRAPRAAPGARPGSASSVSMLAHGATPRLSSTHSRPSRTRTSGPARSTSTAFGRATAPLKTTSRFTSGSSPKLVSMGIGRPRSTRYPNPSSVAKPSRRLDGIPPPGALHRIPTRRVRRRASPGRPRVRRGGRPPGPGTRSPGRSRSRRAAAAPGTGSTCLSRSRR